MLNLPLEINCYTVFWSVQDCGYCGWGEHFPLVATLWSLSYRWQRERERGGRESVQNPQVINQSLLPVILIVNLSSILFSATMLVTLRTVAASQLPTAMRHDWEYYRNYVLSF